MRSKGIELERPENRNHPQIFVTAVMCLAIVAEVPPQE
jgi:hypothetical protein